MNAPFTSPSFPNGLPAMRSEAEVRAIRQLVHSCPFCGGEASLPRKIMTRFLMGCESDTCGVNPQAGGETPEEAARVWNGRAK